MEQLNLVFLGLKKKYRFDSDVKSNYTTEQLLGLQLTELNTIAKMLSRDLKNEDEEDFIQVKSIKSEELSNKLEIVKFIISDIQAHRKAELEKTKRLTELRELENILAVAEANERSQLTPEQIKEKIQELKAQL